MSTVVQSFYSYTKSCLPLPEVSTFVRGLGYRDGYTTDDAKSQAHTERGKTPRRGIPGILLLPDRMSDLP